MRTTNQVRESVGVVFETACGHPLKETKLQKRCVNFKAPQRWQKQACLADASDSNLLLSMGLAEEIWVRKSSQHKCKRHPA